MTIKPLALPGKANIFALYSAGGNVLRIGKYIHCATMRDRILKQGKRQPDYTGLKLPAGLPKSSMLSFTLKLRTQTVYEDWKK